MDILSKNNRFIYQKRNGTFKRILFSMVFIIILVVPVIILSTSRGPKIKFFAYIVCYSFWAIITSLIGLLCIFMKIDKDEGFVRMVRVKITGIGFLVFSILFIMPTYSYCRDIPVIISSEYSYFEGNLTNFHFTGGRSTSTILVFKDKTFKINYKVSPQFTVIGRKYYIEFLPNSKFVMSLKAETTNDILKHH